MTEEVRVTSSTGGQKGDKLARFDLLPSEALWKVAELYGKGARKYSDSNWRKGYPWHLSYAAMQRHLHQFWSGQDVDEETGSPHLASVAFHALALLTFMDEHPEFDDRFNKPAGLEGPLARGFAEEEDEHFRVGDRVRIIDPDPGNGRKYEVGGAPLDLVEEVNGSPPGSYGDPGPYVYLEDWGYWRTSALELVEE